MLGNTGTGAYFKLLGCALRFFGEPMACFEGHSYWVSPSWGCLMVGWAVRFRAAIHFELWLGSIIYFILCVGRGGERLCCIDIFGLGGLSGHVFGG